MALAVGFGASYYALTDGRLVAAVRVGPWAAWPDIGQPRPDPYTRAYLARNGILQLGANEGIQFAAFADNEGVALDAACTYRIAGFIPAASFWTLEATDLAGANIAASPALMALHSERIARSGTGELVASVGPALGSGNWLEIEGEGPFRLALTLYDTPLFSGGNMAVDPLPAITREHCP